MSLIVQKFGGTSVGSVERIQAVAEKVGKFRDQGHDIVVVVSAMSGETNRLIALAKEIARFPQTCMRADRLSALRQWDLSEEEAIANEMRGGLEVIASGETLSGATRFASGVGRHGAFAGEASD